MSDNSSDSDCFDTADEEFKDENISVDSVKSGEVKKDYDPIEAYCFAEDSENPVIPEIIAETCRPRIQYRRRPERRRRSIPKTDELKSRKKSPNDRVPNSNRRVKANIIHPNLSSNLSINLAEKLDSNQANSQFIGDLVVSSLPGRTSVNHSIKFSHDEKSGKDIPFILPNYTGDDYDEDEEASDSSNKSEEEFVIWEEELQPGLPIYKYDKKCVEERKKLDDNLFENAKLISEITKERFKAEEAKRNILINDMKESEDLKWLDNTSVFCKGVEEEMDHISYLKLNIKAEEKLLEEIGKIKGDEIQNVLKDELKNSDQEKNKDNIELKSADTEDNQKGTDGNNDGQDTFEVQPEKSDVKESSETISVESKAVKEDIISAKSENKDAATLKKPAPSCNEGWDDFDFEIDDAELNNITTEGKPKPLEKHEANEISKSEGPTNYLKCEANEAENVWSGWDNFGEKQETKQKSGWTLSNWGVNALLNTATSVTQGLSTVLEAGLGAPDPETLAKMEMESIKDNNECKSEQKENLSSAKSEEPTNSNIKFPDFGITNLVAGVTKNIVEHTKVHEIGSKVISGGLDTLESFGKKTMEVLQEGDPGLKKKRALLLGTGKPTLSHVLREAKLKAEMEDIKLDEEQSTKLCHFETLFEEFQGLVHLEALEMLSRECELKLEQMKESLSVKEVEDLNDILHEVKELCVFDEDEFKATYYGMVDFKITLANATESLNNEISVQKIIQIYDEFNVWFKSEKDNVNSAVSVFEKAMSVLAGLTAATVQQFHKGGELLSVKEHRKTVEEADALIQMTGYICCEIDHVTEKFLEMFTTEMSDNDMELEAKIKEESLNAALYIKDAFKLLVPVLQLGATI